MTATPQELQPLLEQLLDQLDVRLTAGQLILNVNEGRLQSVETRTFQRIHNRRRVDDPPADDAEI